MTGSPRFAFGRFTDLVATNRIPLLNCEREQARSRKREASESEILGYGKGASGMGSPTTKSLHSGRVSQLQKYQCVALDILRTLVCFTRLRCASARSTVEERVLKRPKSGIRVSTRGLGRLMDEFIIIVTRAKPRMAHVSRAGACRGRGRQGQAWPRQPLAASPAQAGSRLAAQPAASAARGPRRRGWRPTSLRTRHAT